MDTDSFLSVVPKVAMPRGSRALKLLCHPGPAEDPQPTVPAPRPLSEPAGRKIGPECHDRID